jgi:hypothetical protein
VLRTVAQPAVPAAPRSEPTSSPGTSIGGGGEGGGEGAGRGGALTPQGRCSGRTVPLGLEKYSDQSFAGPRAKAAPGAALNPFVLPAS